MTISPVSRRKFLAVSAASVTILSSPRSAFTYQANERLKLAVFGTMYNAGHMLQAPHVYQADIVAFCDPDRGNLTKARKVWSDAGQRLRTSERAADQEAADTYNRLSRGDGLSIYSDIRKLLDEKLVEIDALVVSQYDHLHAVACGPALRAGKPVLSERPLGLRIGEARLLRSLAAEKKVPTTYRSPGTAHGQFRRAMELVEDGALGEVREVHVWFDRGGPDRDRLPEGPQPVPAGLNWDAWLGPLPARPYHSDWQAYAHWRETCSGGLGTFGPHTGIFPFMTLDLRQLWGRPAGSEPIKVTAECARSNEISFPRWERVVWEVPARGAMPPVRMTWHHGPDFAPGARELLHRKLLDLGVPDADQANALMKKAGSLVIGSTGAMLANDHSTQVTCLPAERFREIETDRPQRIAAGSNIYRDWVDACRGENSHIIASFDHGGPLSELLMLGNIATLYPEQTLNYDPARGEITNVADANEHLSYEHRPGWPV